MRQSTVGTGLSLGKNVLVTELLAVLQGYFPWIVILALGLIFRGPLIDVVRALGKRVESGSAVEFSTPGGAFRLGEVVADTAGARRQAISQGSTIEVFGDPDQLKLLFKVQGAGWKKSTKALPVPGGCVIQMTTERQSQDGSWTTAEAMQFIPGATVEPSDEEGRFRLGS